MTDQVLMFRRGMKRGMTTLTRERGWLSGLLTMSGLLLIVHTMTLLLISLQAGAQLLESGSALRLEIRQNVAPQLVQEFLIAARDLPGVDRVEYVTREQALERERQRSPELAAFLAQFTIENPFPDTVSVTLSSLDEYENFQAFIRNPDWNRVVDPSAITTLGEQEREIQQLRILTRSIQGAGFVLAAVLLLTAVGVIVEFVRRRSLLRSDEVLVERVSGASEASVLLPFVTEASLLLLGGYVLSALVGAVLVLVLPLVLPGLSGDGLLAPLYVETRGLLLFLSIPLVVGACIALPLLALLGSWLGLPSRHIQS